jgi:hypothetical protein
MMQSERYRQDQVTRQQLFQAQSAKLPGEWLVPVLQLPHSGGSKGGRPAVGPVRGVAAGDSRNFRRVGQSVLRRGLTLPAKLAVIATVYEVASDPAAVPSHVRRQIEKFSGFDWKVVAK